MMSVGKYTAASLKWMQINTRVLPVRVEGTYILLGKSLPTVLHPNILVD